MSVESELRSRPTAFTLFAALRALEALSRGQPRIGTAPRLAAEPFRLAQRPHLEFAPTEVASAEASPRWRLEQFGFGLFGPNGALPLHLTELALDRARHQDDPVLQDFINALQHRWIALFYRAWAASDPATQADRPEDDEFLRCLLALVGHDARGAQGRGYVADRAKAARAGLLAAGTRSADGLEILLEDYFGIAVEVRPYISGWLDIPREARLRLGLARGGGALGQGATLGATTWQGCHSFEVAVGPLDEKDLIGLLPGTRALSELRELVELYTNGEWQWQLRLLVRGETVSRAGLSASARLGQTSWLGGVSGIVRDVVLQDVGRA